MPATLAQLILHDNLLRVFCNGCRRCVTFEPYEMAALYGRDLPLPDLKRRLRCIECGCDDCDVQVALRQWG